MIIQIHKEKIKTVIIFISLIYNELSEMRVSKNLNVIQVIQALASEGVRRGYKMQKFPISSNETGNSDS